MELSDTAILNVRGKQLEILLKQSVTECALGLFGLGLGAVAVFPLVSTPLLLAWIAIGALSYGLRYAVLAGYQRATDASQLGEHWYKIFIATVAATGLVWGALAAWLVAHQGPAESAPLLLLSVAAILLSLCMHAGSMPCALATGLGALLPPAGVLLSTGTREGLLAGLALLFIALAGFFGARLLRHRLWEAAMSQGENEQLRGYLDQRRDQIEKLNVELKTTQGKREQAELGLRRSAADLGLVQGKAKALSETLERISPLDQVTGLDNRRHFDQVLEMEWRRAAREGKPVSMIIADMDEYEAYTESYGRQSADALLKRIGQTVKGFGRRAGDSAGRYDESRIALLVPSCDVRNAARMAEAIRKRVEAQNIPHSNARGRTTLTVHVGVAMVKPGRTMSPTELTKRVEAALYEARFQGGNKVVTYQPLNKLKLERWDLQSDGPLNEQSMLQKLLVWGYDTNKQVMPSGTTVEPQIVNDELVVAILTGELKVEVEGHAMTIKPGDCVIVPAGVELGMETVGTKPVMKFTAAKHK